MSSQSDKEKLSKLEAIIRKYKITCGEDIWQRDSIGTAALEIIQEMCEIVGYYDE